MTSPDDMAARLRRLEDERDIVARLNAVCYAVDGPEVADWLDCYTEDGIFTWAPPGGPLGLEVRGRAALAAWFTQHRQTMLLGTQVHIILHPIVSIDGDHARVTTSYVTLRYPEGEIVVASTGLYEDRLKRCSDGAWRLEEHAAIGGMSRRPPPAKG